ncbi:nucleoside triphosphate pyrophosphatase [Mesonia sp. K7]|uniref:Maf family protein n=1 Tax=Mesonia sp. K7 TaxID=2218606 RepID=UPI000DA9CDC8|nr:Maf family protein [Mesonia sp. K7]PZD79355.1 septum formation protein Maf [Mesonia sp. K7]
MEINPLIQKLQNKRIILGSASPRRKQLLEELGLTFEILAKNVDESYPDHLSPTEVTEHITLNKAKAFADILKEENTIVITGDTIVAQDHYILGKPKNKKKAIEMLQNLSGKQHQVISAVAIARKNFTKVSHDTTQVFFKKLTPSEIEFYIDTFQPYDKAGAYGIQEWIGKIGIQKIEGSFYTVMGLPIHLLYKELKNL